MGTNNSCTCPEEITIYRAWITGKNGKRIYPKNGKRVFKIVIRPKLKG